MKNHWKILGVLLGILVFFNSCQDDTEGLIPETAVNQEGHTHFDTVNGHEIPHIIDFLKSKSNDKMQFTLTDDVSPVGTNRNHEEDLTVTTPLLDQIKQATNSFGKSNYTFKLIEEETRESTYFLNLVVKEYGGLLYMYILKYVPTEGWLNTYTGDQDLSSFDGVIYLYADDGKYLATMDMSQGVSTSSQGRSSDCPDPNTDNGSSDGPGDGTTGPGDGTSTTNGDGSGGLEIGIGAEFGWRCNWRNMIHPNPDVCNNTEAGGEWVLIIIDSAHRSMANRTVCPPPDENCQIDCVGNVDPVACICVEEDEQVEGIDIPVIIDITDTIKANLIETLQLNSEQQTWLDNLNGSQLGDIATFLNENDNSEEARRALEITINVDQQFGLGSPYSDDFVDVVNCCGNFPILIINPLAGVKYYQYVRTEIAFIKQSEYQEYYNPNTDEYNIPFWELRKIYWRAHKVAVQLGLDIIGLIPVFGEVADITNGVIYAVSGDGVNASLSFASAIPIAGWFTTGAKLAVATIVLVDGARTTLRWIATAEGIIKFGSRGQLRKVLGLATGNPLQAHHLIPWARRTHPLVQKAAKSGNAFHLNEVLNGIPRPSNLHLGGHNHYNSMILALLTNHNTLNPNLTNEEAYEFITDLADHIRDLINTNPGLNSGEIADLINFP